MKNKAFILLLCCLGFIINVTAQPDTEINRERLKKLRDEFRKYPPKVLLVQIFTHPHLKEYYIKSKQNKKLKILADDIEGCKNAMIADFNDNFKYCTVYYFYDTSANKIKEGNFEGVLLDRDLKPAKNLAISSKDTNFFVTYFGKISPENVSSSYGWDDNTVDKNELYYSHGSSLRQSFRLVILDHNFMQLPSYTEMRDAIGIGRKYRHLGKYSYNSSTLNLYYWAFAGVLNRKFTAFYNFEN